jgi:hypothetical protein
MQIRGTLPFESQGVLNWEADMDTQNHGHFLRVRLAVG